ncbi:hypothetical protein GYH30_015631 [Glycine max]|nr:hypothetical protein GYH30_015631 [Glycine max]
MGSEKVKKYIKVATQKLHGFRVVADFLHPLHLPFSFLSIFHFRSSPFLFIFIFRFISIFVLVPFSFISLSVHCF